jgi:hypothetical protein
MNPGARTIATAVKPQAVPRTRGIGFWSRRILVGLLVAVVTLAGSGMAYQAVGTAMDRRAYPPPGRLVDVGGYQLHIYCVGEGSPTVILDHVGAANAVQWGLVQPDIAKTTRVCAYDRAGFGWSDTGPLPRDAQQNARELQTLLMNADIPPPYVLVGHAFGGCGRHGAWPLRLAGTDRGNVRCHASHDEILGYAQRPK